MEVLFLEIAVSTSIAGLLRQVGLEEALETVTKAGFRLIDFPLSVFSKTKDTPLWQPDWQEWVWKVKEKLGQMGLSVTQAHASWEQAIGEDFSYEAPYEIYHRTIEACSMLGCRRLVFHAPLYFFRTPTQEMRERVTQWCVRWFQALLPVLEQFDVTAEVENTFDYRNIRQPGDPPFTFTSAADMLALQEGIGSRRVQLCLDTGHANIYAQDVPNMIRAYGEHLEVLHLNDNFGLISPIYSDLHLFPTYGRLDWSEIFSALYEIGYQGVFNLEPVGELPRLSPALRVMQLKNARKITEMLALSAGFGKK